MDELNEQSKDIQKELKVLRKKIYNYVYKYADPTSTSRNNFDDLEQTQSNINSDEVSQSFN